MTRSRGWISSYLRLTQASAKYLNWLRRKIRIWEEAWESVSHVTCHWTVGCSNSTSTLMLTHSSSSLPPCLKPYLSFSLILFCFSLLNYSSVTGFTLHRSCYHALHVQVAPNLTATAPLPSLLGFLIFFDKFQVFLSFPAHLELG